MNNERMAIYTEHYLSIKNKILPFAEKWMGLGDIMLNEISWTPIVRSIMFSLCVWKKGVGKEEKGREKSSRKYNRELKL